MTLIQAARAGRPVIYGSSERIMFAARGHDDAALVAV